MTQNKYGDGLDYWSPTVNQQRDPRWGRNQEVPGEDPVLASRYATQYIHGLQEGEDKKHVQIIATCKHFIANSLENWEGHTRHNFDAKVPKQDLADYYAKPFQACVQDGKAWGIMCKTFVFASFHDLKPHDRIRFLQCRKWYPNVSNPSVCQM